jgi:hypothetical protein
MVSVPDELTLPSGVWLELRGGVVSRSKTQTNPAFARRRRPRHERKIARSRHPRSREPRRRFISSMTGSTRSKLACATGCASSSRGGELEAALSRPRYAAARSSVPCVQTPCRIPSSYSAAPYRSSRTGRSTMQRCGGAAAWPSDSPTRPSRRGGWNRETLPAGSPVIRPWRSPRR